MAIKRPDDSNEDDSQPIRPESSSKRITWNSPNPEAPLVILIGQGSSGKTIALLRLSRFLRKQGFDVEPNRSVRSDEEYDQICDDFVRMLNDTQNRVPSRTQENQALIVDFIKAGETQFRIMETPGEFFLVRSQKEEAKTDQSFNPFIGRFLRQRSHPVLFSFVFDLKDLRDGDERAAYQSRMISIVRNYFQVEQEDRVALVANKVDLQVNRSDEAIAKEIMSTFKQFRLQLEEVAKSTRVEPSFVAFSGGDFYGEGDDKVWTPGEDKYPGMFSETIKDAFAPKTNYWPIIIAIILVVIIVVVALMFI